MRKDRCRQKPSDQRCISMTAALLRIKWRSTTRASGAVPLFPFLRLLEHEQERELHCPSAKRSTDQITSSVIPLSEGIRGRTATRSEARGWSTHAALPQSLLPSLTRQARTVPIHSNARSRLPILFAISPVPFYLRNITAHPVHGRLQEDHPTGA